MKYAHDWRNTEFDIIYIPKVINQIRALKLVQWDLSLGYPTLVTCFTKIWYYIVYEFLKYCLREYAGL